MTGILLFSGVIGNVLSACHIVDALLYLLTVVNFPPVLIPAVCFLLATLMSLFTGSAVSAMLAIIPLMLPVGVQMGCNAGFLMGAIVSGGVIGDNMGDFAAFNEVYAKYFISKPARSCVAVKTLPKGVLCEIEAIAVK